jgi:hypothetical protein
MSSSSIYVERKSEEVSVLLLSLSKDGSGVFDAYFLDIAKVVQDRIMKEGAKARVDDLVEVIYRRKSEVWFLWCGRGFCEHRRSVNVGYPGPDPEVIAVNHRSVFSDYVNLPLAMV